MKLVSVVIPCYNHEKYVLGAIESAIYQTYKDKEIIVVDDGSNNDTKKVLAKLSDQINILITQENQGVVIARNNGIEKASGEYILTLDADDYFEPGFLKKAVGILDNNSDVGMVTCWTSIEDSSGKLTRVSKPTGANAISGLFKNNGTASMLFRKICWEEVGGYDRELAKGFEDWEFGIAIGKQGWKMKVIPEILLHYRNLPNSRNKNARSHYSEIRKYVYKKHKDLLATDIDFTLEQLLLEIKSKDDEIKRLKSSRLYKIEKILNRINRKFKFIF
ncbi:glycosyltransferase family A protein [Christiangramia sp. SM2212]|uniref:Glycosyltransferase family A protein n=1 Tax=Christiangramia sediminicola TaxID=3073267 RepID=A0ABU1EMU0_9FLAO|nr:glycosyltransferase family A protein [Christiangramia sp. SM2212]MDR5589705.1 glycosyltransferase family A protein [Christiangramia sp. SM2212]